jgi:hypothetical protein
MLVTLSCFIQATFPFFSGSMELTLFLVVFNRVSIIAQYRSIGLSWGQFSELVFLKFLIYKMHFIGFMPYYDAFRIIAGCQICQIWPKYNWTFVIFDKW